MMTIAISGPLPRGLSRPLVEKTVRAAFRRARREPSGAIGIRFVSLGEIQKLNKTYRKKDRPTDVLSFSAETPMPRGREKEWGDIVIAPAYARVEAARRKISFVEELVRLVAHGVLHLLGYDHATEADEARMFRIQEAVVEAVT